MSNAATGTTSLRRAPPEWVEAFYAGWADAEARNPPSSQYEAWDKTRQFAYEAGRMAIANIRASGVAVPKWNGARETGDPVVAAMKEAFDRIGQALPPVWERRRYA